MATSAVGPGFLTQSAQFTQELKSAFACAILIATLASLIAQLNVWRVLAVANQRGQEIASTLLPGLGAFLTFLICLGGLVFNIGNVGGVALGLKVLVGLNLETGAGLGACLAIGVFLFKRATAFMDKLTQILGIFMILLMGLVAFSAKVPLAQVAKEALHPSHFSMVAVLTLIGGTVGGYIIFSGGHRLLDAKVVGPKRLKEVDLAAYLGIFVATLVRGLLFLVILSVVESGAKLQPSNPALSAFESFGERGRFVFGAVFVAASLTSIIGAAYTSVSFLRNFSWVRRRENTWVIGFIGVSALIFLGVGKPATLLIAAGALNGLILPLTLAVMLLAAKSPKIVGSYKHPLILSLLGWVVVALSAYLGVLSLKPFLSLWTA
ncbi:NRAMP family divalent metal transporter [Helicobacter ailurogastricus]|uniref:NRAMP family divalent metal transporter n=1 Tax=Helicobacter ailurogastricus TaxID=1578720 RepID=UPI0022C17156|nr:NRAMP family divalent metal transporter [Helicobacter ailurogastricus]GLH57821.1 membrane protein [Helicobacter ailurogastricus]GLH58963.1 membrane protein [Helicobacter ailurogastricus]